MGDRAVIQFKSKGVSEGEEKVLSPCCYLHNSGYRVGELLELTAARMAERGPDVAYAFARLVGLAHESIPGNLSLGVWNQADELTEKDSHGDAGCFVVELDSLGMLVECSGGYGFTDPLDSEPVKGPGRYRILWADEGREIVSKLQEIAKVGEGMAKE